MPLSVVLSPDFHFVRYLRSCPGFFHPGHHSRLFDGFYEVGAGVFLVLDVDSCSL